MRMNGSEAMIKCLEEQGVDTVFGYPGGSVLNIYDALYKADGKIKHILTSHEQGAAHAADGYARATGKTGVCIATSGPGATNLVTGIATAYMDSVPMVAFTGQVPSQLIGKDSFQEVDITGITLPVTKHNYLVKKVEDLVPIIREAFKIANSGRPGPVLIDICKDVTGADVEYEYVKGSLEYNSEKHCCINKEELDIAAQAINKAKKPLIITGGGTIISDAQEIVTKFAEKIQAPVSTTMMGLGGIDSDHKNYLGLIGMHGAVTSNKAAYECDILIAIGARFSDRVIGNVKRFAPDAKIMHIDIDPAEIGKNIGVDYPIEGNVKNVIGELTDLVDSKKDDTWINRILSLKHERKVDETVLTAEYIIKTFHKMMKGDAVITTEVGQNQIWAAQYYKYSEPRTFISSGGLGTMGYGLGASIGVQTARPEKRVINFAGDGSFLMNCNELATAKRYKLPVIIAILNNGVLGMVRQWQTMFYDKRYSSTTIDSAPDFVKLAEAYGGVGIRVTKIDEVEKAIEKAISVIDRPIVIDFRIDKDERVLPIVPPGKAISEYIND